VRINIVTVTSGWILQKISERTAKACNDNIDGYTMTISDKADPDADANYYADLQNCYHGQKTKLDVAYFTHADRNSKQWLHNLLASTNSFNNLNGIVSMNERYTHMLKSLGWPGDKIETITPGETREMFPLRKIKIAIESFDIDDDKPHRVVFTTQNDNRVDDSICVPLAGIAFEIDDPLRPLIPQETHPNCRCYYVD